MDPIDDYGILQLTGLGCMKDLEVLPMVDPIDVHGVQRSVTAKYRAGK